MRLNRRLAAPVYLGVLDVLRNGAGEIALAPAGRGEGRVLDHVVLMRTLPAAGMGPVALARGRLSPDHLRGFAGTLAAFHRDAGSAATVVPEAAADDILCRWRAVERDLRPMVGRLLAAGDLAVLDDFACAFVARHRALLAARAAAGRIRRGHGDLHLANLCLVEEPLPALDDAPGVPAGLVAFDCIEFSPGLATGDAAAEVGFLAMDLEIEGREDLARAFVDAYVAASDDGGLPLLLPLFVAQRALVRALVLSLAGDDPGVPAAQRERAADRARRHVALAGHRAWQAAGPAVIAFAGLSGSGKTTIAREVARRTGFAVVSSDDLRKRRAGLDPASAAPPDAAEALYGDAARRANYEALADLVSATLAAGRPVVADATFHRAADRDLLRRAARRAGAPLAFVECTVDDATARDRLVRRAEAPVAPGTARSDADHRVREAQRRDRDAFGPDDPRIALDTAGTPGAVVARAMHDLWAWRRAHPVLRAR